MRRVVSLNDSGWFVGAVAPKAFPAEDDFEAVSGWIPATVPGDVRVDLLNISKIPNPFLGKNNEASQWVDDYDWWYRREISLEPATASDIRTFLVMDGVDYQCSVYWNENALGKHVGMFSKQIYELTALLSHSNNLLRVRLSGGGQLPRLKLKRRESAWQKIAGRVLPHAKHAGEFPERYASVKCQMSYGWDFAPRLLTCGIWNTAWIVQTRGILIRGVWIQGVPDGRVLVRLEVDGELNRKAQVRFRVRGKNFAADPQSFEYPFQIDKPHVWNPWDRGAPNLYELDIRIEDARGVLDACTETFGLRTIDLAQNPGTLTDSAPWTFTLNGQPEFVRGANWVPADAIPARVNQKGYTELVEMVRDANINLLRVWGGGLAEKRAFYDLCDELGILVWQEFPFAGAGVDYYPADATYLEMVEQETAAIVRSLRNHPSIVLWCGGNEFIPRVNQKLVDILRNAAATHDGSRPFKPASPSQDESHNWRVWHGLANTRDYSRDPALFFGEFGLQAPPSVETLERFLPKDSVFPANEWWEYHNAETKKLVRYASPILEGKGIAEPTVAEFVAASQEAQLRGLQIAIEHARRNKPRMSGCVVWQFNEPWYSICWSLVDYGRIPKAAYWKVKELYNSVLVCFDYPYRQRKAGEIVSGQVWLVNDLLNPVTGTLTASFNGEAVLAMEIKVGADRAEALQDLDLQLREGQNELQFEFRGPSALATNEYDLNYCDNGEISLRGSVLRDAAAWLRTS